MRKRGHTGEGITMIKEFKDFLMRGKLVELAVAVVMGGAFGSLIKVFVESLITPVIAAIFGNPSFGDLSFTLNHSRFSYGAFLNALITFVSIAAAVFFFVVKPTDALEERRKRGFDPDSKECPECLSEIPYAAKRCAYCASEIVAAPATGG
jgi:large conductance mechanosensitive channel